ncbi:hypothetical protein LEL_08596 [Akanthomyces lecanii RCEF 1005]|uniref:Uncharacterized protein n=1 Tax=Akanthomyces lecanii RCEF 1005 TaxID=1081108 RepID=A0A162JRU2_CORDF|nr:hypothetical protein LEL_08596 [Akanthomyces lecanii RCEF 1005]
MPTCEISYIHYPPSTTSTALLQESHRSTRLPIALLYLFAALASVVIDSKPLPAEAVNRLNADLGSARGGALGLPVPTAPAKLVDLLSPDQFTVSLIVGHTAAVTSIHVEGSSSSVPVGGCIDPGTMGNLTLMSEHSQGTLVGQQWPGFVQRPQTPRRKQRTPTKFFALCHRYGGAYTYPDDNDANTLNGGRCRGFQGATCCIGNFCSEWENYPRK